MAVATTPASASAQALFKNGVAEHVAGKVEAAARYYRDALQLNPFLAEAHNNLATAASQSGDNDAAQSGFERAVELKPDYAEGHSNLGILWSERGRHDLALPFLERAVALDDSNPSWFNNLGNSYIEHFRFADALHAYDRGIARASDSVDCWSNRSLALRGLRRPDDAIASLQRALQLAPSHVNSLSNLGIVLKEQKRFSEAILAMKKAIEIEPENAALWANFAAVYEPTGDYDRMREAASHASSIDPDYPEPYNLLANCELEAGQYDAAEALYQRVIGLDPDNRNANWNLALIWLMRGDFERGWKQFEWRKRLHSVVLDHNDYGRPEWTGDPLDGRNVLLHSEQGIGDAIQFSRFAPLVKSMGAGRVYLECPFSIVPLLSGVPGVDGVIARGAPLPAYDVHASLMSLPGLLGSTLDTVTHAVPYLPVEPRPSRSAVVAPPGSLKIGIVWAGNPIHARDFLRSAPLSAFLPLFDIEGTSFFSLQKGSAAELQLEALPTGAITDLAPQLDDFRDTAAVIDALDLVITVDTSVAHLAGALGRPTWLLLPHVADFRWMLDRNDSPWYPSMRLFRQPVPRDWDSVFAEVERALRALSERAPSTSDEPVTGPSDDPIVTLASATFIADGRHRFDLWVPLSRLSDATCFAEYEAELVHGGHDIPARVFLDEVLRATDAFIDVAPGLGLTTLSVVTAPRAPGQLAIVDADDETRTRIAKLVARRAPAISTTTTSALTHALVRCRIGRGGRCVIRVGKAAMADESVDVIGNTLSVDRPQAVIWSSIVPSEHEDALRFLESLGYLTATLSIVGGEPSLDAIEDASRAQSVVSVMPALLDELSKEVEQSGQATAQALSIEMIGGASRAVSQRLSVTRTLGIDWELRSDTGWGVYGINLALELARRDVPRPAIFAASSDQLPVLTRARLRGALRDGEARSAALVRSPIAPLQFDGVMLRALGNNFGHGPLWDRVSARRNVGLVFFEDTMFDADALDRARALDLVVAGSHWNEDILRQRGMSNVVTVLQGIDPTVFHPAPRSGQFSDRFVVFSGGKLEYRKGQDLVVAAFRAFRERHPEALLVVAWHNNWPSLIADLHLAGHLHGTPSVHGHTLAVTEWLVANGVPAHAVIDVGHQPNALMGQIVRECDVALFPNRCEGGTNLVAMECMAAGVPTIVSCNTGHRDLVATGGCISLERQPAVRAPSRFFRGIEGWGESDVDEMVTALELAFSRHARVAAIAQRGADAMAAQSWRHQVDKLVSVLEPLF